MLCFDCCHGDFKTWCLKDTRTGLGSHPNLVMTPSNFRWRITDIQILGSAESYKDETRKNPADPTGQYWDNKLGL